MESMLTRLLEDAGVAYELLPHAHTETAGEEARALGLAPAEVAKTLVATTPEGHVRTVLPASERLDLRKLRALLGVPSKKVHLASEDELARDYPGFDLGAVPPLGGPPGEPVVIDERIMGRESVVLEAGSHEESVRIATADLRRLARAQVADICQD